MNEYRGLWPCPFWVSSCNGRLILASETVRHLVYIREIGKLSRPTDCTRPKWHSSGYEIQIRIQSLWRGIMIRQLLLKQTHPNSFPWRSSCAGRARLTNLPLAHSKTICDCRSIANEPVAAWEALERGSPRVMRGHPEELDRQGGDILRGTRLEVRRDAVT